MLTHTEKELNKTILKSNKHTKYRCFMCDSICFLSFPSKTKKQNNKKNTGENSVRWVHAKGDQLATLPMILVNWRRCWEVPDVSCKVKSPPWVHGQLRKKTRQYVILGEFFVLNRYIYILYIIVINSELVERIENDKKGPKKGKLLKIFRDMSHDVSCFRDFPAI